MYGDYLTQISKADVERAHQYESDRIPECRLCIQWKKKPLKPVDSNYKILFKGAKPPHNYFNMMINSTMEGKKLYLHIQLLVHLVFHICLHFLVDSTTLSNSLPHQTGHLVDGSVNSHKGQPS